MEQVVVDRYFSIFLKGFEDFPLLKAITDSPLTAQNWQKCKSRFLACPCHEIYKEEAVGLESSNYT